MDVLDGNLKAVEASGFGRCDWVGGSCGFPCSAGRVDTEFIQIVTIVANEVGDFAEGLVRYGML